MSYLISIVGSRTRKSILVDVILPVLPIVIISMTIIAILLIRMRELMDRATMKTGSIAVKPNSPSRKGKSKKAVSKKAVSSKVAVTPINPFSKMDRFVLDQYMGVKNGGGLAKTNVIVRLNKAAISSAQRAELARSGARVYRSLPLIQSMAVSLPTQNLIKLGGLPFVDRISSDAAVQKNDEFTVESSGADRAVTNYGLTGRGVGIAVLDTGISRHADFSGSRASRIIADINFAPNSRDRVRPNDTADECGHGTHIAGIIAGNGEASDGPSCFRTFYGIAREALLVNIRVLDEEGGGSVSTVISGITWAIENRNRYNIRVMNISFGHPVGVLYNRPPLSGGRSCVEVRHCRGDGGWQQWPRLQYLR
jgi:subtilisin family serine protease